MTIDELAEYGLQRMSDEEIEGFLGMQSLGVLALATDGPPYVIPMSYGYDGADSLYFSFVVGEQSNKVDFSQQDTEASFLVYTAETMFNWRSVVLRGAIKKLSATERTELGDEQLPAWRPELFETAGKTEPTQLYAFQIATRSGVKHSIKPPAFWQQSSPDRSS